MTSLLEHVSHACAYAFTDVPLIFCDACRQIAVSVTIEPLSSATDRLQVDATVRTLAIIIITPSHHMKRKLKPWAELEIARVKATLELKRNRRPGNRGNRG